MCSASNTDWHLTTHEFVSPGKTRRVSARQVWRFDETWRSLDRNFRGTSKNASWLSPNSRRRFHRQYPTWKRDEVKIDRVYTADKVTRNFRELRERERKSYVLSKTGSSLVIVGNAILPSSRGILEIFLFKTRVTRSELILSLYRFFACFYNLFRQVSEYTIL